jgi:hypothetical protein
VTTITLQMVLAQNSWGINDIGALITPPAPATPTPTGQIDIVAEVDARQHSI